MRELHLFAGAGGGILGGMLLGHTTVAAVEIETYCQDVLRARQRDGILPEFPIFGDIREFDGRPWRGAVDVLCGGFPCQDISAAGKGAGITGERSGLWKEYARLIGEIRPQFVFAENSPLLRTRGLGVVLQDLAEMGYAARWGVLGAWHVGAPHKRDRMWVLAHTSSKGKRRLPIRPRRQLKEASNLNGCGQGLAHTVHPRLQGCSRDGGTTAEGEPVGHPAQCGSLWWHTDPAEVDDTNSIGVEGSRAEQQTAGVNESSSMHGSTIEPFVGRVDHGVAHRVDRLKAIGNGQVPQCAAMAFRILSEGLI